MRERVYPGFIARQRMSEREAAEELAAMRQIVRVLKCFLDYELPIRAAIRERMAQNRELEELRRHPAVETVLETWPDAEVVEARPYTPPAPSGRLTEGESEGASEIEIASDAPPFPALPAPDEHQAQGSLLL